MNEVLYTVHGYSNDPDETLFRLERFVVLKRGEGVVELALADESLQPVPKVGPLHVYGSAIDAYHSTPWEAVNYMADQLAKSIAAEKTTIAKLEANHRAVRMMYNAWPNKSDPVKV